MLGLLQIIYRQKKPVHLAALGLILGTIIAPIISQMVINQQYRLSSDITALTAPRTPKLEAKMMRDESNKQTSFNASANTASKDKLQSKIGAGTSDQLYSVVFPDDSRKGITITDNVNQVDVVMTPRFKTSEARLSDGRVIYPTATGSARLVYTPAADGLKEDIVLDSKPGQDTLSFAYDLKLPDYLEARMMPDGSLGVYSGAPELFGAMSYGSDNDRATITKARQNAAKNYLMFAIPAPVVKQTGKSSRAVTSRFEFKASVLTVITTGLGQASYPLTIDPTFFISSSSDFDAGTGEEDLDYSVAGQIGRAAITGGAVTSWTATNTLPNAQWGVSSAGYNNYLYTTGSYQGSMYTSHAPVNSNGSLGTWVSDSVTYTPGKIGSRMVAYNGYLYTLGGEDSSTHTQYATVLYSKIDPISGAAGTWNSTTGFSGARAFFGATVYKGYIYLMGGGQGSNETAASDVQYVKINGDGTLGTWATTTALPSAREGLAVTAQNGWLYVTGGRSGTSASTNAKVTDVYRAAQNANGTLSSWAQTTSFNTARRDHQVSINNNYMYITGGCTAAGADPCGTLASDTQYAPVYADGTVGTWTASANITTARDQAGMAAYRGNLYVVGGCSAETAGPACGSSDANALGSVQYSSLAAAGNVASVAASGSTFTTARHSQLTTVYDGYMYVAGGCAVNTCSAVLSDTYYASVAADGTIGTWTATGTLPSTANDQPGRMASCMVGYNGRLYIVGGGQLHNGNNNLETVNDTVVGVIGASGAVSSWTTGTGGQLPVNSMYHSCETYNGFIYVIGGTTTTTATYRTTVYYATLNADGSFGTFAATTNTFTTGRASQASAVWHGYLYVGGGYTGSAYLNDIQYVKLSNAGNITNTFTTASNTFTQTRGFLTMVATNAVLYVYGGYTGSAVRSDVQYSTLDPATGAPGAFTTSASTLSTARWGTGTSYRGVLYMVGGCTTANCTGFSNVTDILQTNNGGNGQTAAWTTSGSNYTTARVDSMSVAYNGFIYVMGGCAAFGNGNGTCTNTLTSVWAAPINADGSLGTWVAATALPSARYSGSVVAYNNRIYVIAGSSGATALSSVIYTQQAANGTLGAWQAVAANDMPGGAARYDGDATLYGSYIYVGSGYNGTAQLSDIYYAQITTAGNLSADSGCGSTWCTGTSFTTIRRSASLFAYNGTLYIAGGVSGTTTLRDVQYAPINSNGTIGSWNYTNAIESGIIDIPVVGSNGYIYMMGTARDTSDITYFAVSANGTLGQSANSNAKMAANHSRGSAVTNAGFVYVLGGCTTAGAGGDCTTMNQTIEYTGQQASARIGRYARLFTTGADTAPSQVVMNGGLSSNNSAVQLSFQTASQADPVLGLAQIINPVVFNTNYSVLALDTSGTNVGVAYNYFLELLLDDSASSSFPDVPTSGTQTSINNFILYYHANPGRRLRHGASFNDTSCSDTPATGCVLDTAP